MLRPAQISLIEEMKQSLELGAVLGMGGGKTVATLTAFADLAKKPGTDTLIVLAPPRVCSVWPREAQKWEHLQHLDVVVLDGPAARRDRLISCGADAFVISHDLIPWFVKRWHLHQLEGHHYILAIDEISRFRNPRGKRAKALLEIIGDFDAVWGLTGTPQPDGYEDLYMTLKVLSGGVVWGRESFDDWRRMRFYPKDHGGFSWGVHTFAAEELDQIANEFLMKVPDGHSSGIPELNEGPEFDIRVDPTPRQLEAAKTMFNDLFVELERAAEEQGRELTDEDYIVAMSRGVASGKLEQIAQGFLYADDKSVAETLGNAKEDALRDALEEALEPSLIVYRLRHDLDRIAKAIGGPVSYLGGGVSQKAGQKLIDAFAAGELRYLAIHPLSAGHGIDGLQLGGRRMFYYNPTWSGEEHEQLIKRLHRPGQTKPVYIHQIGTRGLIDELKIARCRGRVEEQAAFVQKLRSMI
jgi:SNF2 family DNA or RNA helicase